MPQIKVLLKGGATDPLSPLRERKTESKNFCEFPTCRREGDHVNIKTGEPSCCLHYVGTRCESCWKFVAYHTLEMTKSKECSLCSGRWFDSQEGVKTYPSGFPSKKAEGPPGGITLKEETPKPSMKDLIEEVMKDEDPDDESELEEEPEDEESEKDDDDQEDEQEEGKPSSKKDSPWSGFVEV